MAERVLVVDDDKGVREALSEYLISLGYTVVTAENGEEALRQYRKGLLIFLNGYFKRKG